MNIIEYIAQSSTGETTTHDLFNEITNAFAFAVIQIADHTGEPVDRVLEEANHAVDLIIVENLKCPPRHQQH